MKTFIILILSLGLFIPLSVISQNASYVTNLHTAWYKDYDGNSTYLYITPTSESIMGNPTFIGAEYPGGIAHRFIWKQNRMFSDGPRPTYECTTPGHGNPYSKRIMFTNANEFFMNGNYYRSGHGPANPNTPPPAATTTTTTPAAPVNTTPVYNRINESTKRAPIHDAAGKASNGQSAQLNKVKSLRQQGADLNIVEGTKTRTAIHLSAINGSDESNSIIEYLAKEGANVNKTDREGKTALDLALEFGNYQTAKTLLTNTANPKLAKKGYDILLNGQFDENGKELITLFLQKGADPDYGMKKAIKNDNDLMMSHIISNSNARANNTYFELAVNEKSMKVAEELLNKDIDEDKAIEYVIGKKDNQLLNFILDFDNLRLSNSTANKTLVYVVGQRDKNLATKLIEKYYALPTVGMAPAVKNSDLRMVEYLLSQGADADDQMDEASAAGKRDIVQALLNQSANPDLGIAPAATNDKISTLQILFDAYGDANLAMPIAIDKGNVRMVNMCIAAPKAADVYRSEYIVTTCEKSNLDILNALLMAGATPDPGMPISIGKGDTELVRELISAGASVQRSEYMIKCAERKDAATAQLLLENGADPNPGMSKAVELGDATMVSLLLQHEADGTKPQHIAKASAIGNSSIVTMLLKSGANANDGMTSGVNKNQSQVVALLIENGADGSKNSYMISSAKHNNASLTTLLIEAGGDPQLALEPAINSNAHHVVNLIKDHGVVITETKYLLTCVEKNHVHTARVLVDAGASAKDWWDESAGQNMLHLSIRKHLNLNMVTTLVKAGVDVDAKTRGGDSPLHLAVAQGKTKTDFAGGVVIVLIRNNANVNAQNARGETVLKAAPGKRNITKPLKAAGAKRKVR